MVCNKCGIKMKKIISFSKCKTMQYYRCPNCLYETGYKPIFYIDMENIYVRNKLGEKEK
jgi:hypothetical protein